MYINNAGPRIDPRGTHRVIIHVSDNVDPIRTIWHRPDRLFLHHANTDLDTPMV